MKSRILCSVLIIAAIGLAGCRNDPNPPYEPTITLSQIRITGIPDEAAILMVVLDGSTPRSRGLVAVNGVLVGDDGDSYAVAGIGSDGTALTPLYYGADIMYFLLALLGYEPPIGMSPPIAVPNVTSAAVSGRGDVAVYYSGSMDTLLVADTRVRVWRNIRFADFTVDRILTLDWNAGE